MKNVHIPEGLTHDQLMDHLEATADTVREGSFTRRLEPHEIAARNERLADLHIDLNEKELVLQNAKDDFKREAKPIKSEIATTLQTLKTKQEQVFGKIFAYKDNESGRIYEYTEYGQLITDRKMTPEERQLTLNIKPRKNVKSA